MTNPERLAYCFVSVYGLSSFATPDECVPLSAENYVRAYYPIPEPKDMDSDEEDVLNVIFSLDGEPVMTLGMLAEAWPQEYKGLLPVGEEDLLIKEDGNTRTSIPTLFELSLKPALDRALERDETQELEDLVWIPGKAVATVADLQTRGSLPNSALSLLAKALGNVVDNTLGLSYFKFHTLHRTDCYPSDIFRRRGSSKAFA